MESQVWRFVTGFFYLACFSDSSLKRASVLQHFLWSNDILLYKHIWNFYYIIQLYQYKTIYHVMDIWVISHLLAIRNNATVNIHVENLLMKGKTLCFIRAKTCSQ